MQNFQKLFIILACIGVTGCGSATIRGTERGPVLEESNFYDPLGLGADRASSARVKEIRAETCRDMLKAHTEQQLLAGNMKASAHSTGVQPFYCGDDYISFGAPGPNGRQMFLNGPGILSPYPMNSYAGPMIGGYPQAIAPAIPIRAGMTSPQDVQYAQNQQAQNNSDGFYTSAESAELAKLSRDRAECEANARITQSDECQKVIAAHSNFRHTVEEKRKLEDQQTLERLRLNDGETPKRPAHVGDTSQVSPAPQAPQRSVASGGVSDAEPAPRPAARLSLGRAAR